MPEFPLRSVAHRGARLACVLTFGLVAPIAPTQAQVNVTTYHNDSSRSGLNSQETKLGPTNVSPSQFGLLFTVPVDGNIATQPLYLWHQALKTGAVHDMVFVATENDSVYAFDADRAGKPLWQVNFGTPLTSNDVNTTDIYPIVGITGTPTIDAVNGLLYVVSKTKETDASGNVTFVQRLHALDVRDGSELLGGPVVIAAKVKGTGDGTDGHGNVPFNSLIENQRPALLLAPRATSTGPKSTVYIAFASHGDNGPYHGWILAYDATTLQQVSAYNTTPNARTDPSGYPLAAGGIWMSGDGPANDGTTLFVETGNGSFSPMNGSFGDSFLALSTLNGIKTAGYFAPFNQLSLDDSDEDMGSGGLILLPTSVGSKLHPRLLVGSGKSGNIFLLDRAKLGGYDASQDNVVQELPGAIGGSWSTPAYFNNTIYYGGVGDTLKAFSISNAQLSDQPISQSPEGFNYPGTTPSISSNGVKYGIVWAIEYGNDNSATLHAYDATNLSKELYSNTQTDNRDIPGAAVKFSVPTVVNGHVYVGAQGELDVYGHGHWAPTPTIVSPPSGSYPSAITVTLSDTASNAAIYYTLDGSDPTKSSTLYTGPFTLNTCADLRARAYIPGYNQSGLAEAEYQIGAIYGNGNGLLGSYYNNSQNPSGPPTENRTDTTINFNWNGNPPITGVAGTNWCAEWNGQIEAECTGVYTIGTLSDDGVRVWVNGQELINDWTYHAPTYDSGTISMVAGQTYTIKIDYFQGTGGSQLQLYWASLGMPLEIVPESQLYSTGIE